MTGPIRSGNSFLVNGGSSRVIYTPPPVLGFTVTVAPSSGDSVTVAPVITFTPDTLWLATPITLQSTVPGVFAGSVTTLAVSVGTTTPVNIIFNASGSGIGSFNGTVVGMASHGFASYAATSAGTMNKVITASNPSASAITGQHIFQMVDVAAPGEVPVGNTIQVRKVSDNSIVPSTVFGLSFRANGDLEKYELLAMPTESLPAYGTGGFAPTYTVKVVAGSITPVATIPDSEFNSGHDFKVSWKPYDGSGNTYWIKVNDVMAGVAKGAPTRNSNPRMRWDDASSTVMQREIQVEAYFSTVNSLATTHGWISGIIYVRSLGAGSGRFLIDFVAQYVNAYGVLTGAGLGGTTAPMMLEGEFALYDGVTLLNSWGGLNDYRTLNSQPAAAFANNMIALPSTNILTRVSPEQYRNNDALNITGGKFGGAGMRIVSQTGSIGSIDPNQTYYLGYDAGSGVFLNTSPAFAKCTRQQFPIDYHPWTVSTAHDVGDAILVGTKAYMCTSAGTSASSGIGPTAYGTGVTDGTIIWQCMAAQVTGVTGTFAIYPTVQLIAGATRLCCANDGRPVRVGFTGTVLMAGHDYTHLVTKSWLVQPYALNSASLADNSPEPPYSLDNYEYNNDLNDYGDNPGDERVGYINSMAAWGYQQPTNIVLYKKTIQRAVEFAGYPCTMKDQRSMAAIVPFSGPDYTDSTHFPGMAASNVAFAAITDGHPYGSPSWPADILASTVGANFAFRYQAVAEASHFPTPAFNAFLRTGRTMFKDMQYNHWIGSSSANYFNTNVTIAGTTYSKTYRDYQRTDGWYWKTMNQADQLLGDDDPRKALTRRQMTDTGLWMQANYSVLTPDLQRIGIFGSEIQSGGLSAYATWMAGFCTMVISMIIGRGMHAGYDVAAGTYAFGWWLDIIDEQVGGSPFLLGMNYGAEVDHGGNGQGLRLNYPTQTVDHSTSLSYFPDIPSAFAWQFNGKGVLPTDFPATKIVDHDTRDANGQIPCGTQAVQTGWPWGTGEYSLIALFALGTAAQAAAAMVARGQTPGPKLARAARLYAQSYQRYLDYGNGGITYTGNSNYSGGYNASYPVFSATPTKIGRAHV